MIDAYLLDETFNRTHYIDNYMSFIWTVRYKEIGEFEMHIPISERGLYAPGMFVELVGSEHLMHIETIQNLGDNTVKVSGRSLESMMENRVVREGVAWDGNPARIAEAMFANAFARVSPYGRSMSEKDVIPEVYANTKNIDEGITYQYTTEFKSLYDSVIDILSQTDYGFVVKWLRNGGIIFQVYNGDVKEVVLDEMLGNLQNVQSLLSTKDYKNVAYALYKIPGTEETDIAEVVMRSPLEHIQVKNRLFDRRCMFINLTGLESELVQTKDQFYNYVHTSARAKLYEHNFKQVFSADVETGIYDQYMSPSDLGAIVTMRYDGIVTQARVTEYTWSSTEAGDTIYPTLEGVS